MTPREESSAICGAFGIGVLIIVVVLRCLLVM